MPNPVLTNAQQGKKDEFYTQYSDIQNEISAYLEYDEDLFKDKTVLLPCDDPTKSNFTRFFAQNFERFKLKKLISTSLSPVSKHTKYGFQGDLFEGTKKEAALEKRGKIFTLDIDINNDGKINIEDLNWDYLEGDGDFRSPEVAELCKQADFVITNPPFSLLREFFDWIKAYDKSFIIVASMNSVAFTNIFPLIKDNKVWLGNGFKAGNAFFGIPEELLREYATGVYDKESRLVKFRNACWLTNLEHGRRHKPLQLMTKEDNLKFNKKLKDKSVYVKYENYDAIEVPITEAIPSNYKGIMGVPLSFLEKYCPEQFEILGICENKDLYGLKTRRYTREECKEAHFMRKKKEGSYDLNASGVLIEGGVPRVTYKRVLIRHLK